MRLVREAMWAVVNEGGGTAGGTARLPAGYGQLAGKTGTTQVRRVTREQRERGYNVNQVPREWRPHALFVAYAPHDNPQYAISVIVEHGTSGGSGRRGAVGEGHHGGDDEPIPDGAGGAKAGGRENGLMSVRFQKGRRPAKVAPSPTMAEPPTAMAGPRAGHLRDVDARLIVKRALPRHRSGSAWAEGRDPCDPASRRWPARAPAKAMPWDLTMAMGQPAIDRGFAPTTFRKAR